MAPVQLHHRAVPFSQQVGDVRPGAMALRRVDDGETKCLALPFFEKKMPRIRFHVKLNYICSLIGGFKWHGNLRSPIMNAPAFEVCIVDNREA